MLRATAAYFLALPIVMLVFWIGGALLHPPTQSTPLLSLLFSVAYFAPLLLLFGLPGALVLIGWATVLKSRAWPVPSLLASSVVLALFAYSSNVMCRTNYWGSDCWGNIKFQLTERSPLAAEYPMVFWCAALSTLAFWLLYANRSPSMEQARTAGPQA